MQNTIIPPKSPNDSRQYEAITLSNGVKVILIHDILLQKSACSISVGVGSLQDYESSLGLAHFLQHMLFMGSKKYPKHNEYSSFISLNSGMDNAYTSDEETNYYFEISNKVFPQALERLSQFFTSALLTADCVSKQRQAVHQEYVLWSNDDNCRKWEVLRKLALKPYSKFTIGNNQTLGHQKVRDDLVDFYNRHYSANIINAVLASSLSIKQMKQTLLKYLQQIPNKKHQGFKYDSAFLPSNLGKMVRMQSIKDESIMEFFWVIEYLKHKYKDHVGSYITHVLGHQSQNSLLNILKVKQYASSISSYQHDIMSQTIIGLQLKLTQEGQQNYQQVYNIVIDYVSCLKSTKYIFEEIKAKAEIDFQFKQKKQTYQYVCSLSSDMHHIPLPEILNYKSLSNEYNQNLINSILAQLNPFNLIVVFSTNQEIPNSITEKYLGAKYIIDSLPQRKNYFSKFQPLSPNPFLPLSKAIISDPPSHNSTVKLKDYIYYQQDSQFKVCRGGIGLGVYGSQTYTFLNFYSDYLSLLLKPITYDAQALGVKLQMDGHERMEIDVFGFSDTVKKLVGRMGDELINVHQSKNSETLFEIAKSDYLEDIDNFYSQEVDEIATQTQDLLFNRDRPSIAQIKSEVQKYQYNQITVRAFKFWKTATFQWVIIGNFKEGEAIQITQYFQNKLSKTHPTMIKPTNWLSLTDKSTKHEILLTEPEISTSCCIVHFQAGKYSEKLYYTLNLLKNHIDEPYFNQLRTQKQLAYYLSCRIDDSEGVLGLNFLLVSSTKDSQYISQEINKFVHNFYGKLDTDLTEDKMKQLKQSIRTKFITPHNNLQKKFQFICNEVRDRTHYFDRKNPIKVDEELSTITKKDLIDTAQLLLSKSLQILVVSVPHQQAYRQNQPSVKSFQQIKQQSKYYDGILGNLSFSYK